VSGEPHPDSTPLHAMTAAPDRLHTDRLATLGELAARAAHDINGQLMAAHAGLNTALLIARRLQTQVADDVGIGRLCKTLADAERAMSRIATITHDMTLFARPPREQARLIQIDEVVREALCVTSCLLGAEVRVLQRVPEINLNAVSGLLVQLVVNLLVNAAHALGPAGGTIAIDAEADERQLLLCVQDDGPGVPPELRARIFEPYFTTKPRGVGTGLGLAICREIAERHGGSIALAEQGPGARFEIVLPL
jgi:two-component system NtrC family sensor kinase